MKLKNVHSFLEIICNTKDSVTKRIEVREKEKLLINTWEVLDLIHDYSNA